MSGLPLANKIQAGETRGNAIVFTIFPDGAKAVVDFSWNNTPASFVLHFEFSSPVAQDYIDLAEAVAGEFATNVMPNLSVDLVMGEIMVSDMSE